MSFPARLFVFVLSFFIFTAPASAQTTSLNITSDTNPTVPSNLHAWTQNVMIEVMAAATCQLAGVDPINPNQKCLGVDPKTNSIGFVEGGGGAIGLMGNLIALTYTPPLHTGDYFSYLAQNFGIAKPAYAQGVGFEGLSPLIRVWTAFRNMAYLLFVLVFIIVGLAIMLRIKIDPRTVMTIENQIPKIIVGLLLVTFSYAIAGFLIDLMYLTIYITGNVIASADPQNIPADIPTRITQSTHPIEAANIIGGLGEIAGKPAETIGGFIAPIFDNEAGKIATATLTALIIKLTGATNAVGGLIKGVGEFLTASGLTKPSVAGAIAAFIGIAFMGLAGAFAPNIMGFAVGFIAFLIIAIALLWALLRIWFELLKAYIGILLDVVFAPFWVVVGLFPGSSIGFGAWIRDIIANLSVFPVTIIMFLLGRMFISAFGKSGTNGFVPPLIGNAADPKLIGPLIGLGVILLTPQVLSIMRELLKSPQFKYSAAVGQAVGVGPGLFMGGFGVFSQLRYAFPGLPFFKGKWFSQQASKPEVPPPTTTRTADIASS